MAFALFDSDSTRPSRPPEPKGTLPDGRRLRDAEDDLAVAGLSFRFRLLLVLRLRLLLRLVLAPVPVLPRPRPALLLPRPTLPLPRPARPPRPPLRPPFRRAGGAGLAGKEPSEARRRIEAESGGLGARRASEPPRAPEEKVAAKDSPAATAVGAVGPTSSLL